MKVSVSLEASLLGTGEAIICSVWLFYPSSYPRQLGPALICSLGWPELQTKAPSFLLLPSLVKDKSPH